MTASDSPRPQDARPSRLRLPVIAWVFAVACLAVGGAMVALGVGYLRCSRVNAQVQAAVSEISMIIGGARQNYGKYGYSGLTTAVAIGSRVIPEARADGGGMTATNGYAGAITLIDNSAKMAGTAILSYADVPAAQCAQIVAAVRPLTREIGVQGIVVTRPDGTIAATGLDAQCASAAGVKIDFVFGRI